MSEIPKAAIEAFIAAMSSEDPPSWLQLSGPMQEGIAKRAIEAALPHLDGYAARQGVMRETKFHAVNLEQCSLVVDSEPIARAMGDAAAFLRAQLANEKDATDAPR